MKKVLIVYFSTSGKTERMAEYIAEGVRFNDIQAVVKNMEDIKDIEELLGYDGYLFGSPTFSMDIPESVKIHLSALKNLNIENKLGGVFGSYIHDVSYRHDAHAPALIFNILQNEMKMKPFYLGPLILKENLIEIREGIQTCHDYGRAFGAEIG
jgi:multimeric flavodoxin WrbA